MSSPPLDLCDVHTTLQKLIVLRVQKQVASHATLKLRLGDEVEMGNSIFKVFLVVPNPGEDEEATTSIDDNDLAQLQKDDYEMGDMPPADDAEEQHEAHHHDDDEQEEVEEQEEDHVRVPLS